VRLSCNGLLVRSLGSSSLLLLLCDALGDESVVFGLLLLLRVGTPTCDGAEVAAALETERGDETLDFRSLGVWLGIRLLRALNLTPDDILANVVLLGQVEEFPDLGSPLGTETLGEDVLREAGEGGVTLLDDHEGEHGDIGTNDAAADGLALALAGAAGAVAGVAVGKEELDTIREEDTLLHGETLLVVSSGDAEDVALEFIPKGVSGDFLADPLFVEDTETALIVDVDGLLFTRRGVGNVELHDA